MTMTPLATCRQLLADLHAKLVLLDILATDQGDREAVRDAISHAESIKLCLDDVTE